MTHISVLELALREPSRLAADLAGHRRYSESRPTAVALRGTRRFHRRRRPTSDSADA